MDESKKEKELLIDNYERRKDHWRECFHHDLSSNSNLTIFDKGQIENNLSPDLPEVGKKS